MSVYREARLKDVKGLGSVKNLFEELAQAHCYLDRHRVPRQTSEGRDLTIGERIWMLEVTWTGQVSTLVRRDLLPAAEPVDPTSLPKAAHFPTVQPEPPLG
jgi:hypothetical protein